MDLTFVALKGAISHDPSLVVRMGQTYVGILLKDPIAQLTVFSQIQRGWEFPLYTSHGLRLLASCRPIQYSTGTMGG